MADLNMLAQLTYHNALKRGRIKPKMTHFSTATDIQSELLEFAMASETKPSEHLPQYTEAQEELADIVICGLTELYRRNVNVEAIIIEKVGFNETRANKKLK